ncbi:MAG TPA: xylose isomerase [Planctomycetaceae bacterium]|nr:xylose isomerase [Planctomycetaceae bacterium]
MPKPKISAFPKCYLEDISQQKMSLFDWIDQAKQLDCDGLEMYEGFFKCLVESYLLEVRSAIEQSGFVMPMLCCSPDFTHPDAERRQWAVQYQQKMIRVAYTLGGPGTVCRVLSGQRWPELTRSQGLQFASQGILACLPLAEELGVVLGLENHYKDGFWKFAEFAQKQDVFLELLSLIPDSKYFGVQYDPSNAVVAGDDPVELLRQLASRVVSMHASDRYLAPGATLDDLKKAEGSAGYAAILHHGVTGKGLNDYPTIFSILRQVDYSGWISIEDGMNGMDEMAQSLKFLRQSVDQYWSDTVN